jgi:hypothetical protein
MNNDWRANAGCRDQDPDLFFPIGSTGPAVEQTERAKAVCRRCKVITQCLEGPWLPVKTPACGAGCPKTNGAPYAAPDNAAPRAADKQPDGRGSPPASPTDRCAHTACPTVPNPFM